MICRSRNKLPGRWKAESLVSRASIPIVYQTYVDSFQFLTVFWVDIRYIEKLSAKLVEHSGMLMSMCQKTGVWLCCIIFIGPIEDCYCVYNVISVNVEAPFGRNILYLFFRILQNFRLPFSTYNICCESIPQDSNRFLLFLLNHALMLILGCMISGLL